MSKKIFLLGALASITLVACNQNNPIGKPMSIEGDAVATVNGVAIKQIDLDSLKTARQAAGQPLPDEAALEEAISLELIRQQAVNDKLHEDTEIAAEINRQASTVLASAYMRKLLDAQPVSDEDLQKIYNERTAAFPKKEFKSRHILSKTEEEAVANIAALKKGKDFAKLAQEKSTGPSAPNGGDLGWAAPSTFVPEFADALQKLEVGKYSETPVKTQFGWHVLFLEEVRDTNLPTLDSLRPQLQRFVINQRIQETIKGLKDAANIQITEAEETPKAEATTETAAAEEEKPAS